MGQSESRTWDRSIPDEQQKVDEDLDSGQLTPYEEAQDLSQEFAYIDRRTVDTDTILCDVAGIYKASTGGSIAVEVNLPGPDDATKTFNFESPRVWSGMYEFVRWVDHYGYGSSNFEAMIKDDVEVEVSQSDQLSDYELYVPERDKSVRENIQSTYKTAKSTMAGALDDDTELALYIVGSCIITYAVYSLTIGGILGWQEVTYSMEAYSGSGMPASKNSAVFGVPALSAAFNLGLILLLRIVTE